MSGAIRVWRAELVRLLTSRSAWIGGILIVLVPVLRVWAAVVAQRAKDIERLASGRERSGYTTGDGWAYLIDGWRAGLMLATALLLVQSARAIAGDRETGVFRLGVTRSASRSGAVVGRALLGPFLTLALIMLSGLGAYAAAKGLGGNFGDLVEDDYMIFSVSEELHELKRALQTVFMGMVAVHAFGILVSSLSRGPVLALAASLACILLWDVFKEDVGQKHFFVFASHAPTFADGSAMKEMAGFARGMSDAVQQNAIFNMGRILPPLQAIVFIALSCLAIRKRPI